MSRINEGGVGDRMESQKSNSKQLTLRQVLFCEEYLKTGNATKAAKYAYDATSYQTQRSIGHENLTKPHIQHYLKEKLGLYRLSVSPILERLKLEMTFFSGMKSLRAAEKLGKFLGMF